MTGHPYDREANLRYVRDMLKQLEVVAGAPHGSLLGYLLEMARLEAEHQLSLAATQSEQ
jgi:alpha/beta superfamily hydrolase